MYGLRLPLSIVILLSLATPVFATPLRLAPGQSSITVYEGSGGPVNGTCSLSNALLTTRLSDPVGASNYDFEGVPGHEYYDLFYSDADGTFNADGAYLTFECVYDAGAPAGGALNVYEVRLNGANLQNQYANVVSSSVQLGDNAIPGSQNSATDGNLTTATTMGNTVGQSQRLRLTLGFAASSGGAVNLAPSGPPPSDTPGHGLHGGLLCNVTVAGGGAVTKNPDQPSYAAGNVVQLTATPSAPGTFGMWTGDASGSANTINVTMDGNKNLIATFLYSLNVTTAGSGTIARTPDLGQYYLPGTIVQLLGTPISSARFWAWDGDVVGSANPVNVMMDNSKNITAYFASTLNVTTVGGGTVTKSPNLAFYPDGIVVQLTAVPTAPGSFLGWSGDASGSVNPLSIAIYANTHITATFSSHSLSVTTVGAGTVAKAPDQSNFALGAVVQLTATPTPPATFLGWSGDASGATNPLNVTMDTDKHITATFGEPRCYSDDTFNDSDWQLIVLQAGSGGSAASTQEVAGGNPGAYRAFQTAVNAGAGSAIYAVNLNAQAVYAPASGGAIASLDYDEDAELLSGAPSGQLSGPALRQGGVIYICRGLTTPEGAWTHKHVGSLLATDFSDVTTETQHPNFGGLAIQFGYYRGNVTNADGYAVVAGIDNWSVCVLRPDQTTGVGPALTEARGLVVSVSPNPSPSPTFSFSLPTAELVNAAVYDVLGRRVRGLNNSELAAGVHTMRWDGTDARGKRLRAGMYFLRMSAGTEHAMSSVVLVK